MAVAQSTSPLPASSSARRLRSGISFGCSSKSDGTVLRACSVVRRRAHIADASTTLLVTEEDYIDTDETPPGGCRGQGKFETWDLSRLGKGVITPQGTWETELNGMFTSGAVDSKAPVTVNCSSHWFDAKSGVAAVGWYEQGVRFLDYRTPTDIQQVGYYIPAAGSTWAAYWSPTDPSGQIVYTADAYRGVDVLKIDGGGLTGKKVKAPVRDEWLGDALTTSAFVPHPDFGFVCPVLQAGAALG